MSIHPVPSHTSPRVPLTRPAQRGDPRHALLCELLRRLQTAVAACSDELQAEGVHRTRVAARRLRAVLHCLRAELHPVLYCQLEFDSTNLGRTFAELRTADVRLRLIAQLSTKCPNAPAADRCMLIQAAEATVEHARSKLRRQLHEPAWARRMQRLCDTVAQDDLLLLPTRSPGGEARALLVACLHKTARDIRHPPRSDEALHRHRIRIKRAGYASELLLPQVAVNLRQMNMALKRSQDLLGEVHDLHPLEAWLCTTGRGPLAAHLSKIIAKRAAKRCKRYHRLQPALRKRLQAAARVLQRGDAARWEV